jgi:predicted alpha/beta superfamily hydrolase
MKNILGFLVFILLCQSYAIAQTSPRSLPPFTLGVVDQVKSAVLSETRILNIYLPDNYKKDSATSFPVIYLLDGSADEDFVHIAGLVQFLTMINVMKPSIVVGIANVDRRRDFTFPTHNKADLKVSPTSGSSAKFILFLEKELEPYVQQHYRTNASKTIIGQSLGGLLATEVLLRKPSLFTDYIIVSPSLWWDDGSLVPDSKTLVQNASAAGARVFFALGNEGKEMQDYLDQLLAIFKPVENDKFKVTSVPFPEESHATILHRAVYKGIEVLNPKK